MSGEPLLLPVLAHDKLKAWPVPSDETGEAPEIDYREPGDAFARSYLTDAHFAAYSVPGVRHRLRLDALGLPEVAWRMVLLVVDVDAPGHGEKPTTDDARAELSARVARWWQDEQPKLAALDAAHPGALTYRSRSGGYRLVWRLASPVEVQTTDDKEAWRTRYHRELLYLIRRFRIFGDPRCADLTRLFRLPRVTREGATEPATPEMRGDPAALGVWSHVPTDAELMDDRGCVHQLANRRGAEAAAWATVARRLNPATAERGGQEGEDLRPQDQDEERVFKRAAAYLASMEPSIEGSGGDAALWAAALAMVRGFALGAQTGAALLARDFNGRCSPPWHRRDIERKARQAAERGQQPWGYLRDADGGEAGLKNKPSERRRPRPTTEKTMHDEARAERMRENMRKATAKGPRPEPRPEPPHDQADDQQGPRSTERPTPTLPAIELNADLPGNITSAVEALARCPDIYTRGTTLSQIVIAADPDNRHARGTPLLRSLPRPTLREKMCEVATWQRWDARANDGAGAWRAAIPTDAVVQGVESRGAWPGLRPIVGVARTPFLRRDGSVCEAHGYDDASGFVLITDEPFPSVPERPTQDDARAALALILDLFCDFPCIDDASRHVPTAALLTMLAMPALGGANVPAFLIEASTPGTGKGLMLDVVCILATGREVAKSAWRDNEEMEKVLGAAALEGASVLAFDNISTELPFGGSAIDLVLTCSGQYKPRVLGRSESPTLPWRAVVLGTGNNITIKGDTRRRVLLCRQQTTLEKPEERDDFKYPHLRAEARTRRGQLVCAALTILRAHALAGRPAAVRRLGSFEEWGATVASAIAWAGGANVLEAMPSAESSDDPALAALGVLLEAWPLLSAGYPMRLGALADKLYPAGRRDHDHDAEPDDGLGHVREALEQLAPVKGGGRVRFDARRLGYVLRAHRARNIGGRAFQEGAITQGSKTWTVVDPSTGQAIPPGGGRGGRGGSSTSDAGASRASAGAHTHTGEPPDGPQPSPSSPSSPGQPQGEESQKRPEPPPATSNTPPPVSHVATAETPANDPAPFDRAAGDDEGWEPLE